MADTLCDSMRAVFCDQVLNLHAMKPTILKKLSACPDAVKWAKQFNTLEEAWLKCERSDWMLWFYKRCDPDKKICVQMAVEFAERVLPIFEAKYPQDQRPRKAIDAVKEWLINPTAAAATYAAYAAHAANAAAYAAAADAAHAAHAATYAAYAAHAANAAAYAADADADAHAATYAAYAAHAAAAERKAQADIIRKYIPKLPTPQK